MKTNFTDSRPRSHWLMLCVAGLLVIGSLSSSSTAASTTIDFEDLLLGTQYRFGQGFVSSGMSFCVDSFTWSSGQVVETGFTEVSLKGLADKGSQGMWTNNANLRFDFGGVLTSLELDYGAHGGNVNIEVNGERKYNLSRPSELNDTMIGGVTLKAQQENQGLGHLTLEGAIKSFAIGGQEFALDNIVLVGDYFSLPKCGTSAVRLLLVTQGDQAAEYNASIIPGIARGHPNQFNQWIVTVLDRSGQPLDAYGVWDPRLTLVHDVEGAHSKLERDSNTAYLFDVVLPFTDNYHGGMPAEVLLHDQELTLLADVDLSAAINRYCKEFAARTPACQTVGDGISITPASDLPEASFKSRPTATTNQVILADSERVAACLPPDSMDNKALNPEALKAQLQGCGLLK